MNGLEYLATMTEAQFQSQVIQLAELYGWKHFHPYDSRRSVHGWPDLVLVRNGLMIFAELKKQGRLPTKFQREWLTELEKVHRFAGNVIVRLWHPSDLSGIAKLLETGWRVPVAGADTLMQ